MKKRNGACGLSPKAKFVNKPRNFCWLVSVDYIAYSKNVNNMKRKISMTVLLFAFVTVCFAAVVGLAGKWKGSLTDPNGNNHDFHLVFNTGDGDKLTGTAQAEGPPLTINNGKISGNNFTFSVTDDDGNVIPVDGKYIPTGDSISLNFTENGATFHVKFVRDDK
jgi:hypothetical protein